MADADGDQLDRRAGFDIANDLAEMAFEITGVHRKGQIVVGAIGNTIRMRRSSGRVTAAGGPIKASPSYFPSKSLTQHRPRICARRGVGGFVDNIGSH